MMSRGKSVRAESAEFMSALLTFFWLSGIVAPSHRRFVLSQRHSGLPRAWPVGHDWRNARFVWNGKNNYCGEDHGRRAHGPARRLDLVRRRTQTVEGREDSRADARASLCQLGIRRRTRLWRRNLQIARAHRASDPFGGY